MTEERRVQLVAEVDTTRTRTGFQEIVQQAGQMAQQVTQAGDRAEQAVNQVGQQASTTAQQVSRAGQQAAGAVGNIGSGASTSSRNVDAAQRNIVGAIQRTTAAMQAGGRQTAAYYELMARQRGVDPSTLAPYLNALRAVEQQQSHTGASTAQVANAMRMVPAQLSDIASQLVGGASPFTILVQQGSQLRDSFGSIPATLRGVGASLLGLVNPFTVTIGLVAGLAYAYSEGLKEVDAYNRALILSGNTAGATAGQLQMMAKQISDSVGTQGQAAAALAALASTGEVGAESLQEFGRVAIEAQRGIGQSAEETAKQFAELGKSPVEASVKLTETYHYLSAAVLDQIKALDKQGQSEEASALAQKTYANALSDRMKQVKDSLGTVQTAWGKVGDAAGKAWDQFLNIGRPQTIDEQIAQIDAQLARAKEKTAPIVSMAKLGFSQSAPAVDKEALEQKRAALVLQKAKEEWDAAQKAIAQQMNDAMIQWDKSGEQYLSKIEKRNKDIEKVRAEGLAAGVSDKEINDRVAKVYAAYASLDNPALKALENQRDQQREILKGQLEDLESSHKQQLVSESDYISKKRDLQLKEIDLEVNLLRKKASVDGNKEDKSERDKDLSDLQVALIKRQNIIRAADNELAEYNNGKKKTLDDAVAGWNRTLDVERDAVSQEVLLFGKSDQARAILLAQMKVESDARQEIAKLTKNGIVLSKEERAEFDAQTEAAKQKAGDLTSEKLALAAANQLRRDNLKFSAEYIADADLRARRIMEIDAEQWQYLINNTEEGSEARKLIIEQFDRWYANRQMQPVLDRWKGVIDNLDNNFQEGFRDMLTSGKSAWSSFAKSIGNTLKTSLADALYQTFLKRYVVQIVAGLAGVISGPAVADVLTGSSAGNGVGVAGAGSSGLIGAAQTASSLYKVVSNGFAGIGSSISSSIGQGISSLGNTLGSQSMSAFGSGMQGFGLDGSLGSAAGYGQMAGSALGAVASVTGGILAGRAIGGAISGGYGSNSAINTGTAAGAIIGSIIPGLGTAIGGVIGGALGGLYNRAFGYKDKEITSTGIKGTLSSAGATADSYAKWEQEGGWFRSDKDGVDSTPFSANNIAAITNGLSQLKTLSSSFADSLGVDAASIANYSKTFNIDLGKDGKIEDGIVKLLTSVGDELATTLVPSIMQFAKTGESAATVLERLAGDFNATTSVAQLIGKTAAQAFGTVGIESAYARERLVDLAGSASNLTSLASSYAQNFLTEGERLAPVAAAVDEAMSSLGLSWVTTREQFKQVVDSLDLTSQSGAETFTSLMQLSEAFAQVHAASDKLTKTESAIADERRTLQDQLDQLTMTSAELLAKQRDALDASNQSLFDQVQAAQKVKDAQDAAKTSLGDFITKMKSFSETAAGLNNSLALGDLSTLTPEQQYIEARKQFEATRQAAAAGDATAQGNLQSIEQTFLQLSMKLNAGDAQYSSDLATVMRTNDELSTWAASSVDVAQASLDALNNSSVSLTDISATLTQIAQGVQYLPAVLTGQDTSITTPTYTIDYSQYGTGGSVALAEEVKALRALVADLVTEAKGRRADAQKQSDGQITAGAVAVRQAAEVVVDGMKEAATDAAWAAANSKREPT